MTAARDHILARIRAANGGSPAGKPRRPSVHPIPARARGGHDELVARFVAMADEASATLSRVDRPGDVPRALADYLAVEDLPLAVAMSPDPRLRELPWDDAPGIAIRYGAARPDDAVGVTPAFAGIAETGTLMVHSGPATPNTLHFLPETHIAVLAVSAIVGSYEEAWERLRRNFPIPPRSVTLITGPSRSSDIERSVQIGVHGPRRLHIVLCGGDDGEAS